MKLYCVTITGLDDYNDYEEILKLSRQYPWLEWGVLLSEGRIGQPRYPSRDWLTGLKEQTIQPDAVWNSPTSKHRFAAHLCGQTMRDFVTETRADDEYSHKWMKPFGLTPGSFSVMFSRAQINFNVAFEGFDSGTMQALLDGWYESYSGNIITQHNTANHWVWETMQQKERGAVRAHQILHDASGGRGKSPDAWARPIAGVLNGYAGGIRPETVLNTLIDLEQIVGDGYIWIDMEGGVRDENDRMNMPAVHHMLQQIAMVGHDRKWF